MIYKELVETNTTLSAGDCTLAAKKMADRLKAAGYPDEDMKIFVPEGHPKEGGLIAVLHGSEPNAKAILMLAHVDVVEAKREDWTRNPFELIEENGYFYGRGTSDMKAQAAIWVDNMIRYREEGFKPKRSIKLALTCGEETNSALNGAGWLAKNDRSNAWSFEKSGGLGNTFWVNAKSRMRIPIEMSKPISTKNDAATAG